MDITFSDTAVRDLCCSRSELVRRFGNSVAGRIGVRLALLSAAPTLQHVPVAPPVGLSRLDAKGKFAVALGAAHHLVLQAPVRIANDLASITEIQIIGPAAVPAIKGSKK